jgi:hypothetical protein
MPFLKLLRWFMLIPLIIGGMHADELYRMPPRKVETRWASPENPSGTKGTGGTERDGRKGRPNIPLRAGESAVLADVQGTSGTIHRIWLTIDKRTPETLRGVRIEFYWDGADKPAVNVPLGDFFGNGLGQMTAFQSALFSNPEGRSFNCTIPMPFRTGMKIRLINESAVDIRMVFYDVNFTVGDRHDDDTLYFHAWFNRENPTTLGKDYAILAKVSGRGRFLGTTVGVIVDQKKYHQSWWGEGEVKIYLDGDSAHPTLCGTGTEDYIGSAWSLGTFSNTYQGCTLADPKNMWFVFYRQHVPDPVFFHQDIRVDLQQIGLWDAPTLEKFKAANSRIIEKSGADPTDWNRPNLHVPSLYERADDVSSCAYFYLDRPTNDLPAPAGVEARLRGLVPANRAASETK